MPVPKVPELVHCVQTRSHDMTNQTNPFQPYIYGSVSFYTSQIWEFFLNDFWTSSFELEGLFSVCLPFSLKLSVPFSTCWKDTCKQQNVFFLPTHSSKIGLEKWYNNILSSSFFKYILSCLLLSPFRTHIPCQ